MKQNDRELIIEQVGKAQQGDKQAIERIYKLMINEVYYYALKMIKNPDDAMDVTQESFITAFKKIKSLQNPEAFISWLYRITANNCKDLFNKHNRYCLLGDDEFGLTESEDEATLPAEVIDKEETSRLMKGIIEKLPEAQKSCVIFYYFNELSIKEIAEILECSEGTIKSRLNYARKQIKEEVLMLEKKKGTKLYNVMPLGTLIGFIKFVTAEEVLAQQTIQSIGEHIFSQVGSIVTASVGFESGKLVGERVAKKTLLGTIKVKVACGTAVVATCVGALTLVNNGSKEISFENQMVEQGIRYLLDKQEEKLYDEDLENITTVKVVGEYWIKDLKNVKTISYFGDISIIADDEKRLYLKDLNEATLNQYGITRVGATAELKELSYLTNLEKLFLLDIPDLDMANGEMIMDIESLKQLHIRYVQTPESVPDFSSLKNLEELVLSGPLDTRAQRIVDISALDKMTHLTKLSLAFDTIKDYESLMSLTNLEELDIWTPEPYFETSIIQNLLHLEKLSIRGLTDECGLVTDESIFQRMPSLQEVEINNAIIYKK